MSALTDALDAAYILLTEDHHLVEAFNACRRGRLLFRPDYDLDQVETDAHLQAVEIEAQKAAALCSNSGLPALALWCERISNRIGIARRQREDDTSAVADLARLTAPAVEELDRAVDEHAAGIARL